MRRYTITVNDVTRVIDVEELTADTYRVQIEGRFVDVRLDDHRGLAHAAIAPTVEVLHPATSIGLTPAAPGAAETDASARPGPIAERAQAGPTPAGQQPTASTARADRLTAPMPGVVLTVLTSVGAAVTRGQTLLILEAMKMKNELKAPRDGVVAEVYVGEGAQVRYGEALVRFEEE